jgi:DUF1680 family protein
MNRTCLFALVASLSGCWVMAQSSSSDYPIRPVPATEVELTDQFWRPRIDTNRERTVEYCFRKCEETGRIENFKVAGGLSDGRWVGEFGFNDSDVSKVIEGAAYCLMTERDEDLELYLDQVIRYMGSAQQDDGYLYTLWTARDRAPDLRSVTCSPSDGPWSQIAHAHQLYNLGHMYEAAVAHHQATGKTNFLEIATKSADLVDRMFGPGKLELPPGHQEIELGLIKLYRTTGNERYLRLAQYFLDQRGKPSRSRESAWGPYSQDHMPVVDQREAVGHAVRAGYMYAAMTDIAAMTGDAAYGAAVDGLWQNVVGKKMYLTGGVGATAAGEAFGGNFELPNLTAYNETCAAIAQCMWNHRMFLLHGDSKYIDVLERVLYNGTLSGVALDGENFFYPNPLESDGRHARSPWFGCSCCPTNVVRFIPSVPGYAYAVRGNTIYVNLFAEGTARLEVAGQTVTVRQETDYPWDGNIKLTIEPEQPVELVVKIRIPGWARNQVLPSELYRYVQQQSDLAAQLSKREGTRVEGGYWVHDRKFAASEAIAWELPMPIRRVEAADQVEANRGLVALERGPLVYCVEHADVPDGQVVNLVLEDDVELATQHKPDLLGGVVVIRGSAAATKWADEGQTSVQKTPVEVTAIPYYAWAHRGSGEMAVWLARNSESARPLPAATIASMSKVTASAGWREKLTAPSDQRAVKNSLDKSNGIIHWWPKKGTREWVQYDFATPHKVSSTEIYWFDDRGVGECRVPKSWKLMYREGDKWREVEGVTTYPTERDTFSRIEFEPVETDSLRVEVEMQEGWSTGLHEWRVR